MAPAGLHSFDAGATVRDTFGVMVPSLLTGVAAKPYIGVLDADLALRDLRRTVRYRKISGLLRAARTGFLRICATTAFRETMRRKIDLLALEFGWDPGDTYAVWVREYVPYIRFVDVSNVRMADPRVRQVFELDAEDGPTARLVRLITPDVFLSCNHHHFPRYGTVAELYGEDWSIVTVAYRDKSTRDAIFMGTTFGGTITWNVSASAIREVAALIAGIDRRILVGIGLLAVLVLLHPGSRRWFLSHASETGRLANQAAQTYLSPLVDQWTQLENKAVEAAEVIAATQCKIGVPRCVRDCAATVLARADRPLSVAALRSAMNQWGYDRSGRNAGQYLLRVLRDYPQLFQEDGRGRWRLAASTGADRMR